ncbi:recQ-mediated genome instability 1 [Paramuricea clavata]|uniref:RecQ-mediated genome instability protein 1 n=1 Tax=Paramuricea clavata TaxID=317549 RepID=A0A6S7FDH4_PARCT|nr:recQ-mediated genome instability 1 [Paramuricea clavata]
MAATEQEIVNIFEWLETTKLVTVNIEWLEACISWLKSRGTARGNLNMQLKDDIYEQWLMSDLSESGSNCLPDQISTLPSTSIQRIVALQMNSIVNIGASAYSQLKKLKNEVNENTSVDENRTQTWQPQPCRMLKLELTDGEQTIEGMEYQPMTKLSTDLIPGTKVLINADTLCRSGMLFLTDENIEILGGQVQNLTEENSQLNILNRLVRNGKEGEVLVNNTGPRQDRSSNHHGDNPPQDDDFEALMNDDDIFAELDGNTLAQIDGNMDPVQVNGRISPAELVDNIDDDIPQDVLDNLSDIENDFW